MVDLIKFKANMRKDMLNIYRTKGYAHAVQSVKYLIKNSNVQAKALNLPELPIQIRGEGCEILLELGILEYARQKNLPWIVYKGLVLERKDYKKGTTELDITLFTPGKIILFESKYRKGKIKLIDECKIVPDYGSVADVYKQNLMHLDNLRRYLVDCIITTELAKPFKLVLFVEDSKRVTDSRSAKDKRLVPLIDLHNLESYLREIEGMSNQVWDMKRVHDTLAELDKMTDENLQKHMKSVSKKKY